MTEQELDLFMRNVLLDAIALDEETNTETIPYAAGKIMANRPIFAVQRFDCKLRTCKEQINDLNIIHKESHPSIYYLANWGEILHQSKNFYREFWKIPCSPLSYCCPNIKSNMTSKISFLYPDRFSFHSITDVRGYQTLEGFRNIYSVRVWFGTENNL